MYESVRQAQLRFIAAGDSWFAADSAANLLQSLVFAGPALAMDCALPWSRQSVDAPRPSNLGLYEMLGPSSSATASAIAFDAVLISAGGDDLFEAASVRAFLSNGEPTPREQRLLLRRDEWKEVAGGGYRYISEQGISTLEVFLQANFDHIVRARDQGPMRGKPIFIHGYADPVPRPARTRAGLGPWLQPALADYGIPIEDHLLTAQRLMFCLRGLLRGIASDTQRFPNVHFFDGSHVRLERAGANQAGEDGDWASEVHPNASGYAKLAQAWSEFIESVLRPKQGAA
jgi:lysophospholipase L1-like esterase